METPQQFGVQVLLKGLSAGNSSWKHLLEILQVHERFQLFKWRIVIYRAIISNLLKLNWFSNTKVMGSKPQPSYNRKRRVTTGCIRTERFHILCSNKESLEWHKGE